ncbi:MAG TPA: hypothetical protein DCQ97_03725, partial [Chitinophagaceae bacterium]|nr:hypothetical protein [Chitinophagaceae bacterium]
TIPRTKKGYTGKACLLAEYLQVNAWFVQQNGRGGNLYKRIRQAGKNPLFLRNTGFIKRFPRVIFQTNNK